MICPNCAFPNDPDATQCRKCHYPLAPEGAPAAPAAPAVGADFTTPRESAPATKEEDSLSARVAASLRAALEKENAGDIKSAFLICQSLVIDHFENLPPDTLAELYLTMARLSEKQQRPDRAEKYRQKAAALQAKAGVSAASPSVLERMQQGASPGLPPPPRVEPAPETPPLAQPAEELAAVAVQNAPAAPAGLILASFGARALATLIDVLVVLAVMLLSMKLAALLRKESLQETIAFFGQQLGTLALLPAMFLVFLLGYQTLFTIYGGQTAGKMLLGLRVVGRDGRSLAWKDALRRLGGLALCWISGLAGFLWIGFDDRRQGWHDKLGNTLVIRLPGRAAGGEKSA
jgi:uncharacterized RDD family membrane protein YckC